jgi:hypothetical protein
MTDFRALCAELLNWIERASQAHVYGTQDLITRARLELDKPEGEGPDHASLIAFAYGREPWATWLKIGGCLESAHCELSDLMADVLARWGRPAASAPSEAAWALAQLLDGVQRHDLQSMTGLSDRDCDRIWAARSDNPTTAPAPAPKPIPVSERPWERDGWRDTEGRCWFCNAYSMGKWNYQLPPDSEQDWGVLETHCLPHWAIARPRPEAKD